MFLLISFVLSNNYCVETTTGKCKELCKGFQGDFEKSFNRLPYDTEINTNDNSIHNIYVVDNVEYRESSHNIISCDPSVHLIYNNYINWGKIKISDDIQISSTNIKRYNISILFQTNRNITLEIDTTENSNYKYPIIIKTTKENLSLTPIFLTRYLYPNSVSISKDSFAIKIFDITDNVKLIFNDTNKLLEIPKTYYCISDKQNKCQEYSSKNLTFIDSPSEITNFPIVLIVDSSLPQFFSTNFENNYAHIIGLPGSDITYHPNCKYTTSKFYTIIHDNTIEMTNGFFEGTGNFTLSFYYQLTLHSTTKINNNKFTLKHQNLFNYEYSQISAYKKEKQYEIANKINVPDFNVFHGDDCLINLFESGKFILQSSISQNIGNVKELKEYYYDDFQYYFTENKYEIPKTWKKSSYFIGNGHNNITFNDCYSFSGYFIDNFIYVDSFDTININPAKYFHLKSFSTCWNKKFRINVDHDFIMEGDEFQKNSKIDRDEIKKEMCTITGKGTITFLDADFMDDVKQFCNYDNKNIKFNINSTTPEFYLCVGQSDLSKCKSEIANISLLPDKNWIWLRNIETTAIIYNKKKIFITDQQKYSNLYSETILTENSHLLYQISTVNIRKNGISYITAQKSSAKLTILFNSQNSYYEPYLKKTFRIYYEAPPTEIDLMIYLNYEHIKLYQYYIENFQQNSVLINGKGVLYIREPYLPMIPIYKKSKGISFAINQDPDYLQICYAENVNECINLCDFVFSDNYNKFVEYDNQSIQASVYLHKNISLSMNSNDYVCYKYYIRKKITIDFDLPDISTILFNNNFIEIIDNKTYFFQFYSSQNNVNLDIKDVLILDGSSTYYYSITFTSSKSSVEIIPSPDIKKIISTIKLSTCNNFLIFSPVPQIIKELENSNNANNSIFIEQSPSWSYLYLSEDGKGLFEQYQSFSINDFQNDCNISENIVLAVGKNDILTIPSNWSYHNIYILQENLNILGDQPTNLTYLKDGIILNNNTKIISGKLSIYVPNSFMVNSFLPDGYQIKKFMYNIQLNCSKNTGTTLHIGFIHVSQYCDVRPIRIYNYSVQNKLKIKAKNQNDYYDLKLIMYPYEDKNIEHSFGYDYICYYPHNKVSSKCYGKFYEASDITTLLYAVNDNPNIPIYVGQNLNVPCCTGYNFTLNPKENDIHIKLPDSPDSMMISENNKIKLNYFDSYIDINNKTSFDVSLENAFRLDYTSNTTSEITFILDSDVLISTKSNSSANFSISVIKKDYHFYAEYVEKFGKIFGDSLEPFIQICAYDSKYDQFCSFIRKDLIENIFKEPFNYNEIEIAPLFNNKEISLPSINKPTNVFIHNNSRAVLCIKTASIIQLTSEYIIIDEYWNLIGNLKILTIKISNISAISIPEQLSIPINLQLTSNYSIINLKDCIEQESPKINILKLGNESNEITVFGENTTYHNFINSIDNHDGIRLIRNGTQKYLCVCNDTNSYLRCKKNIDGVFDSTNKILSDPGENVKIRIFSNYEVSSEIFTNKHDVFIDQNCSLNITNVCNVNQNLTKGIQIDNLILMNNSNVLLKPSNSILNVTMKKGEWGNPFSIEIDSFLKLNVLNSKEEDINASRIYVSGHGELNTYNYPFNKIRANRNIKVIKGVYIICGSKGGNSMCSYNSNQGFYLLNTCNDFREDFDPNSKIIVFLDSFSSSLDVHLHILRRQKIQFIREQNDLHLLNNQNKLRILSTKEITSKADLTTELSSDDDRGAVLDSADSDLYIIGFNESLSIKQEGDIPENLTELTIQPMSEKVEIHIDDSVDIQKQKVKIEAESEKKVSVSIVTNKIIENETLINNFLKADSEKVEVIIGNNEISQTIEPIINTPTNEPILNPTSEDSKLSNDKSKSISSGLIIGISVAAVVVIVVIILLIVIFVKKKKSINLSDIIKDNNEESSESIGL